VPYNCAYRANSGRDGAETRGVFLDTVKAICDVIALYDVVTIGEQLHRGTCGRCVP
jgi:hypothetical protein